MRVEKSRSLKIFHCFLVPHQPRLDWQMWFAALGSYQYNPWFISLIDKLLNNKKDVLALLAKNPFHERAPQFIKSTLYLYGHTKLPRNTSSLSDGIIKARLFFTAITPFHNFLSPYSHVLFCSLYSSKIVAF